MIEVCFNCKFWKQREGKEGALSVGYCRRRCPVPTFWTDTNYEGQPLYNSAFDQPTTSNDDWCGEWEKKDGS